MGFRVLTFFLIMGIVLGAAHQGGASRGVRASFVGLLKGTEMLVRIQNRTQSLRLAGIWLPSCGQDERAVIEARSLGVDDAYHTGLCRRARDLMTSLLQSGEAVTLEFDVVERDRDDALVAFVYRRRDGVMLNEALVRRGLARARPLFPQSPNGAALASAEREALAARRGLWETVAREQQR